ncbi:MAG: DUF3093 domain-containing protein [Candidatus Nanopelagicaceae bacterium]|nr:DUF3093 domain-containing protein [Candidatus Nanopelagicaceae bacterium]
MDARNLKNDHYTQIVKPPPWLLAFIFFLLASVALSIWAAFDNPAGMITLTGGIVLLFIIRNSLIMKIDLTSSELRIGPAHIDRSYLGQVTELTVEEMRLIRGRDADPAAFLAIRFWQPHGVKITVDDPRDPTPYWLISAKNAKGLVEALKKR